MPKTRVYEVQVKMVLSMNDGRYHHGGDGPTVIVERYGSGTGRGMTVKRHSGVSLASMRRLAMLCEGMAERSGIRPEGETFVLVPTGLLCNVTYRVDAMKEVIERESEIDGG